MNDDLRDSGNATEFPPQGSTAPYGRPSWSGLLKFSLDELPGQATAAGPIARHRPVHRARGGRKPPS